MQICLDADDTISKHTRIWQGDACLWSVQLCCLCAQVALHPSCTLGTAQPRRRSDSRQKYDFSWSTGGAFEEEYEEAAPQKKELFYTEGPASLKQARLQFANFSLDRAARRLAGAKRKRDSPDEDEEAERADTVSLMKKVCACLVFLPA